MMTPDIIWQALESVKDPEIPVVSLVVMGLVRDVVVTVYAVVVTMTPKISYGIELWVILPNKLQYSRNVLLMK